MAQSRKVLNCTSEEITEGSLTPALYPQCIPLMYYASVDRSGTRLSTGPPGSSFPTFQWLLYTEFKWPKDCVYLIQVI